MRLSKLVSALLALLLLSAATGFAAEGENLAEKAGKWTFTLNDPSQDVKKLGAARLKNLTKNLKDIAQVVTESPVMTPPKGFEARFWGSINHRDRFDICSGKKCPPTKAVAVLAMMMGRYEESNGKVKAAFNAPSTMDFSVNNLGQMFAHLPTLYKDKEGYLLPEPQRDGERLGFPAYRNNGYVVVTIARSSTPMWLPVSRERYLLAAVDNVKKELGLSTEPVIKKKTKSKAKAKDVKAEELPKGKGKLIMVEEGRSWVDPANEKAWLEKSRSLSDDIRDTNAYLNEKLQKLQAELDALTPEQRQLPARIDTTLPAEGESSALLPADGTGGVAVVSPNFGFFNRKLPADAIQLITLQWKFDGNPVFDPSKPGITENLNNQKLLELYKSAQWQKLLDRIPQR